MEHTNSNILPVVGNIPLDIIDCFDRAIGICLASYNISFRDTYFCIKLFNRIYFSNTTGKAFLEESIENIRKFFPLEVRKAYITENICNFLEECSQKGNPIIVPINLKELFYSEQYKILNWAHPIVVKGFDNEKQIFKILDGTQLKSDFPEERDFNISYDVLEQSYESYFKNINQSEHPYVIVFEKGNYISDSDENLLLWKKILLDLLNKVNVRKQIQAIESFEKVVTLLNFSKRKKKLFKLIIEKIDSIGLLPYNDIKRIESEVKEICNHWEKACFLYAKDRLSGSSTCKINVSEEILIKESLLLEKILLNLQKSTFDNLPRVKKSVENDNGIINFSEDEIIFDFKGERLYNSWISDESPKVILGPLENRLEFREEYFIKVGETNASFLAGYFLRLSDRLYYFGLDSCKRIIVDIAGIESSVKQVVVDTDSVYLQLRLCEGNIYFLYKLNEEDAYTLLLSEVLTSEKRMKSYGIGCKTYDSPQPLRVVYSSLKIRS